MSCSSGPWSVSARAARAALTTEPVSAASDSIGRPSALTNESIAMPSTPTSDTARVPSTRSAIRRRVS